MSVMRGGADQTQSDDDTYFSALYSRHFASLMRVAFLITGSNMSRTIAEDRLTERLTQLANLARTTPSSTLTTIELLPTPSSGGRWKRGLVGAAAVMLVVVGLSIALVAGRSDDPSPSNTRPADDGAALGPVSDLLDADTFRTLPAAPIEGRYGPAAVWDGSEMIVWGGATSNGAGAGDIAQDDGAAYNPRTNRWRLLPPAPISGRAYASAVWTGSEMIVWGGADNGVPLGDGAAYDPRTNSWRELADAPIPAAQKSAAVWTGDEMIVVGGLNLGRKAAAYKPATDEWRSLPDAPGGITPPYPRATWTGTKAIFALENNIRPGGTNPGPLATQVSLASYDPAANRWTTLTNASASRQVGWLTWTGDQLLSISGVPDQSAVFDLAARTWSEALASPPTSTPLAMPPVWSGKAVIFWAGGSTGLAYTPLTNTWSTYDAGGLPERVDGAVVWADGVLLGWGGFVNTQAGVVGDARGVMYRPADSSSDRGDETSQVTSYQLPEPDPSTANPTREQIEQEFEKVLQCLDGNGVKVVSSDLKITKYDVSTHLGLSNMGAAAKQGRQDSVQQMCNARFANISQQWTKAAGLPREKLEAAFRDCVAAKGVARDTDIEDMDQVNVFIPCMRQSRADVLGVR